MQRFERIIGILLYLRTGGRLTADALAQRFDVSTRTIYRDLDLLGQLGVPLYAERGRGGGIRLMPGYFLPPVTFTGDEAMSLVAGLALLGSFSVVPFADALDSARRKLLAAVPDELRSVLSKADHVLGFETPPDDIFHPEPESPNDSASMSARASQFVSTYAEAIFQGRNVHMLYRSPYRQADSTLDVNPLGLFWDRQRWYLVGVPIAQDGRPRERGLFRADRVRRISLGARTERRSGFDVRAMLDREWLRSAMAEWASEPAPVRIRINSGQRDRLQRDWYYRHASYASMPNGEVLMTFGEVDQAAVFEFLRWLGPDAELLEPAAWREPFETQLEQMTARYREKPIGG